MGAVIDDRWTLEALIAHSSRAATYRALHRNGAEVALKIIHRSRGSSEATVDRFLKEAHLANRINHAGVERVLDDGKTDDGCVFLVMELLEGESLEQRRARSPGQPLPLVDAITIVDGILDALVAIHSAGVVHRNLKPENVLLTKDDRVVITDFGRARLLEGPVNRQLDSIDGFVMGTPAYMAPEQARGKRDEVDAQSDIFSAGAIFFTMLTGRRVHEAKSAQECLSLAAMRPAPPIASILPDIGPPLAAVVDRALAFSKADRFGTAEELRGAFLQAIGREAAPPAPAVGKRRPSQSTEAGWSPLDPDGASPTQPTPLAPDLAPPSISAFAERAPVSTRTVTREARSARRTQVFGVATVVVIVGVVTTLVALFYSSD